MGTIHTVSKTIVNTIHTTVCERGNEMLLYPLAGVFAVYK